MKNAKCYESICTTFKDQTITVCLVSLLSERKLIL